MLKIPECIQIINNGRKYKDCMEFSLLRFLQLCTCDPKQITYYNFSSYPIEISSNPMLKDFIIGFPTIFPNSEFYSDTKSGFRQRYKWVELLSNKPFFDYYQNDKSELFTSVENIIYFFNGFFHMNLDIKNLQQSLNLIGENFSNQNKIIILKINGIEKSILNLNMNEIIKLVSRPQIDPDYIKELNSNKIYQVISKTTFIDMYIDGYDYQWVLTQVYFANPNLFNNSFITGHSIILNYPNV